MGQIPMDLAWEGGQVDVSLDLNVSETRGIADACRIAGLATQAGEAVFHKMRAQSEALQGEVFRLGQELADSQKERFRLEKLSVDLAKWRARSRMAENDKRHLKSKIKSLRSEREAQAEKRLGARIRCWWKRVRGKS